MRIKLNRNLKIVLISITVILLGIISFFMYQAVKYPGFEEEKTSLYSYKNRANIDYKVFLKPNILYDKKVLDPGGLYISEFIDYIDASFNYEFLGERVGDIKGDYEVVAEIEGYSLGEDEKIVSIWRKGYVFLPKKSFNTKGKSLSIKEELPINLKKYDDFAKLVIEASKINSKVKLTIFMNVNLKVNTDAGTIVDKLSPSIVIPLNTNLIQISGKLIEEKPGNIEETKQIQLPINRNKIMAYGIIVGVLFVILIFLLFFTKMKPTIDPIEKMIKKIFKKHGDRLVALNSEIAVTCEKYCEVKSIEDLVRIADEIEKPIMYKHSSDYKEISKFYISDEAQMYLFDLSKILISKKINNSKKDKSQDDVQKLKKTISKIKASKPNKEESDTETTESKS